VEHVAIGFQLDEALVARIAEAFPDISVIYRPELLAPRRHPCDHVGDTKTFGSPGQKEALQNEFSKATIMFGSPLSGPDGLREIVLRCPNLKWLQSTASGFAETVEAAALPASATQHIMFTTAAGVHAQQLAEWALLSLLYFRKDIPQLLQDQNDHHWHTRPFDELAGSTVLVLGLGHVGMQVANKCQAMGVRVIGVGKGTSEDTFRRIDETDDEEVLRQLVLESDAVVLCLPHTQKTAGLFSKTLIDALPSHGIVVNIGRGTAVDSDALLLALTEGRLRGAALDVTSPEPLPLGHELWDLPNVLLSSHSAALSLREDERLVDLFIQNLGRRLSGDPLLNMLGV
jgi:phosphoglycerate dehydrogenase-like enzyme